MYIWLFVWAHLHLLENSPCILIIFGSEGQQANYRLSKTLNIKTVLRDESEAIAHPISQTCYFYCRTYLVATFPWYFPSQPLSDFSSPNIFVLFLRQKCISLLSFRFSLPQKQ